MPSEQQYSSEFKKKVAQKALDQSKKNLDKLSGKYDVPVSVIQMWATELEKGGEDVFEEPQEEAEDHIAEHAEVDVEITDKEIADSIEHGVMFDNLNYKRLIFWCVFGTLLLIIFIQSLFEMFQYNERVMQEKVSEGSEFYQAAQLERDARNQLESFGVVDLDNGTYHIPIDSAINEIAAENN